MNKNEENQDLCRRKRFMWGVTRINVNGVDDGKDAIKMNWVRQKTKKK